MGDASVSSAPVAFHPFDRVDGQVHARELINPGFASIIVRKNCLTQLDAVLEKNYAVVLPVGPQCAVKNDLILIGTAPGAWLAYKESGGFAWASELASVSKGLASVSDQSSAYVVVRVAGEKSRQVLQKGAYLDLDPSVFRAGSAATTDVAHMSVLICWPRASGPYYVVIPRSYGESFRHWLEAAAMS